MMKNNFIGTVGSPVCNCISKEYTPPASFTRMEEGTMSANAEDMHERLKDVLIMTILNSKKILKYYPLIDQMIMSQMSYQTAKH